MREVGGRIVLMDFSGVRAPDAATPRRSSPARRSIWRRSSSTGAAASVGADIYSLGVLLFYLLSGHFPVDGEDVAEIRRRHASGERVRLRDIRPELPDAVVEIVERATAVDRGERFRTAGDLEHALMGIFAGHGASSGADSARAGARGVACGMGSRRRGRDCTRGKYCRVALRAARACAGRTPRPALGRPALQHRSVAACGSGRQLDRVRDDRRRPQGPVAAPARFGPGACDQGGRDYGDRVLVGRFPADRVLQRREAEDRGRCHRTRRNDGRRRHAARRIWNADGVLLYGVEEGIARVAADGSGRALVTSLDQVPGDYQHGWPEFLPDGNHFLYVVRSRVPERTGVYYGSLESPSLRKWIMPAYSRVAYSPTGHLLFVRNGALLAQSFDPQGAVLSGEPMTLSTAVKAHNASDGAFDVSSHRHPDFPLATRSCPRPSSCSSTGADDSCAR